MPGHFRSDNGSEFTAKAVREWLADVGVSTLYIEPGSPWENGYVESFNGKLGDELLDWEVLHTLLEVQVLTEQFRQTYNRVRLHSISGYRPPAQKTTWPTNPAPNLPAARGCGGAGIRTSRTGWPAQRCRRSGPAGHPGPMARGAGWGGIAPVPCRPAAPLPQNRPDALGVEMTVVGARQFPSAAFLSTCLPRVSPAIARLSRPFSVPNSSRRA